MSAHYGGTRREAASSPAAASITVARGAAGDDFERVKREEKNMEAARAFARNLHAEEDRRNEVGQALGDALAPLPVGREKLEEAWLLRVEAREAIERSRRAWEQQRSAKVGTLRERLPTHHRIFDGLSMREELQRTEWPDVRTPTLTGGKATSRATPMRGALDDARATDGADRPVGGRHRGGALHELSWPSRPTWGDRRHFTEVVVYEQTLVRQVARARWRKAVRMARVMSASANRDASSKLAAAATDADADATSRAAAAAAAEPLPMRAEESAARVATAASAPLATRVANMDQPQRSEPPLLSKEKRRIALLRAAARLAAHTSRLEGGAVFPRVVQDVREIRGEVEQRAAAHDVCTERLPAHDDPPDSEVVTDLAVDTRGAAIGAPSAGSSPPPPPKTRNFHLWSAHHHATTRDEPIEIDTRRGARDERDEPPVVVEPTSLARGRRVDAELFADAGRPLPELGMYWVDVGAAPPDGAAELHLPKLQLVLHKQAAMGKRSVAFSREELELLVGPRFFDQIHAGHYLRAGYSIFVPVADAALMEAGATSTAPAAAAPMEPDDDSAFIIPSLTAPASFRLEANRRPRLRRVDTPQGFQSLVET